MLKWAQRNIYDVRPLGEILKTLNHCRLLYWSLKVHNSSGYFIGQRASQILVGSISMEETHALSGREELDVKSWREIALFVT